MNDASLFQVLEQIGSAPLMALIAFMLWKIEKRITILAVKIEYAAGLKTRAVAHDELAKLGADTDEMQI